MRYLIVRLQGLLRQYAALPESIKSDNLAMVRALQETGEPVSLLEYKSPSFHLATVTVDNLVSFTEKIIPAVDDTSSPSSQAAIGAASQLSSYLAGLLQLVEQFTALYNQTETSAYEMVNILIKSTTDPLLRLTEIPFSVTVQIPKVVSFTEKTSAKDGAGREEAARRMIDFLSQLADSHKS